MGSPFTLTLLEATVTLYPTDGSGAPVVDAPIWVGIQAEKLDIRERWIKTETRPTGALYPRKHPIIPQYEIAIGRVWALDASLEDGVSAAQFDSRNYVLDVVWIDEDTHNWHRETFYNVTISEHNRPSRNIDEGFTDDQLFDAESKIPDGGLGDTTPPAITAELPYTVVYVGLYGSVDLYRYNSGTQAFAEVTAGITSGRATLSYSPTNKSGTFSASFDGAGSPALEVQTDGEVDITSLIQGAPNATQVPRLDFYYGPTRVASITAAGELLSFSFTDAAPSAGIGKFQIYANSALALTLAGPGATAPSYVEA